MLLSEGENGCGTGRNRCSLLLGDRMERTVAGEAGNWDFSFLFLHRLRSHPDCAASCCFILMVMTMRHFYIG